MYQYQQLSKQRKKKRKMDLSVILSALQISNLIHERILSVAL